MALAALPLALSLAVVPAAPTGVPQASTYDQATCATVLADGRLSDGWERAAIGEDAPAPVALPDDCRPVAPPLAADCNDPLVSPWVGEMIGTCDMPHGNGPSLRAARGHDEHRAQRLLAELAAQNDGAAPLGVPAPQRESVPALLTGAAPLLSAPALLALLSFDPPRPLRSISIEGLLRPPRA